MFKRIVTVLVAWALILAAPLSIGQVVVDATKTGVSTGVISSTWANVGSAVTAGSGAMRYVSDLGEAGSVLVSNGTRWRALNGSANLKGLGAQVTGITNSETIVTQVLMPAGSWQTNDVIRIWLTAAKSGTTDIGRIVVRVGTAGTTADTGITGLTAVFALMAASGVSAGAIFDIKLLSATSAQKLGDNGSSNHSYQNVTATTAVAAATTISDASTNALYVSVALQSAGVADTMSAQDVRIQLITP